ncbi:hypothetical protein B0H14DRAFT_3572538 [Mycena olivaceomarginata]|nr:hypothetical protein B0H14DRAFT_3572538 [Mycena olivaceomarginata]
MGLPAPHSPPPYPLLPLLPTRTALTRTQASCGSFLGVSDSFAAALWGLDCALQMAHSKFSSAMFHLGGQNVFYNVCFSFLRYDDGMGWDGMRCDAAPRDGGAIRRSCGSK